MNAPERILISIGPDGVSIDAPARHVEHQPMIVPTAARSWAPVSARDVWREQGGTYAGIVTPRDGSQPYHLIAALVPEAHIKATRWGTESRAAGADSLWDGRANTRAILEADPGNAIAAAITSLQIGGFSDWYWPSRLESAVLFANVGDLVLDFIEGYGCWISEQHADGPSHAWMQYFDDGLQNWVHKDYEFGAVAVRSISA